MRSTLARSPALLLLLGLGAACAHIPDPGSPGVPDGDPIEAVRLEGAMAVDAGEVVGGLANRPPELVVLSIADGYFLDRVYTRFDPLQVELDRRRIRSFYERKGYFAVDLSGPEIASEGEEEPRLTLTWRVEEGEPARITEVILLGAPEGLEPELRAASGLENGQAYRSADFETAKTRLRALLVRRGYAGAEVSGRAQIARGENAARVILDLDTGPLVHFGRLRVEGPVRTPTSAVTNRRTWTIGQRFDPTELQQLRGRLYGIDQYAGVRLDYEAGRLEGDEADILARVEELEQNELQLGLGFGLDQQNFHVRARARYKRRSFPLPLTNLALEATPELQGLREDPQGTFDRIEPVISARATLTWFDFLFPRLELKTEGGYENQQLEAFEWQGPDVGQTLSRALVDDRMRAAVGWRLARYDYTGARVYGPDDPGAPPGVTPQEILNITGPQSVIELRPALTWEGRDDPLNPRRGVFAQLRLDLGFATGPDSSGFALLHPEIRSYLPLGDRVVLAGRIGFAANLDGRLPAPRRLYAGGASSNRGFPQRRLSPSASLLDRDGDGPPTVVTGGDGEPVQIPIGGETRLELNVETRVRLVQLFGFWLGVAAFLDGSDLGRRPEDIDVPNLYYSAGGGLRYLTPIGAIRVDYGYRLNRTSDEDFFPCEEGAILGCGAIHISLGEAF